MYESIEKACKHFSPDSVFGHVYKKRSDDCVVCESGLKIRDLHFLKEWMKESIIKAWKLEMTGMMTDECEIQAFTLWLAADKFGI